MGRIIMTKKEFAKIWLILTDIYTWFSRLDKSLEPKAQKATLQRKFDLWFEFFKDDDYTIVMSAVQAYISTSEKTPTIASIRKQMVQKLDGITPDEAWGQVLNAVQSGIGYNLTSRDRYNEIKSGMDERAFKIGERMGWGAMAMADVNAASFDRGQFIKLWNYYMEREQKMDMLPQSVKASIETNNRKKLSE